MTLTDWVIVTAMAVCAVGAASAAACSMYLAIRIRRRRELWGQEQIIIAEIIDRLREGNLMPPEELESRLREINPRWTPRPGRDLL